MFSSYTRKYSSALIQENVQISYDA